MTDLTQLIRQVSTGEAGARDEPFAAAYAELRKLVHARLRGGARNTVLDTTTLVHESYFKFLNGGQLRAEDRRAFFAYASCVMRSVIIDSVRERQAERHGGHAERLTLNTQLLDAADGGRGTVARESAR